MLNFSFQLWNKKKLNVKHPICCTQQQSWPDWTDIKNAIGVSCHKNADGIDKAKLYSATDFGRLGLASLNLSHLMSMPRQTVCVLRPRLLETTACTEGSITLSLSLSLPPPFLAFFIAWGSTYGGSECLLACSDEVPSDLQIAPLLNNNFFISFLEPFIDLYISQRPCAKWICK